MDKKEWAYAKQAALSAKDWDIFQAIIRNCRKLLYPPVRQVVVEGGKRG
jgi:hypothetical protein